MGGIIDISRRNVELVRQIAGGLLVVYVAIIVLAMMTANDLLDKQTASIIQNTLDLPTAITLVAFCALSAKLELDKPKYRQIQRTTNYNIILLASGALLILALIYIKYFA
jgi:hypothetical protein